ncbi:MAG: lipid-binding SYLF domain-containing protein [Cryomorphaceae bacterium]|jgi:lipid-binding SYLF domain-containing protein
MKRTVTLLACSTLPSFLATSCSTSIKGPIAGITQAKASATEITRNSRLALRSLYNKSPKARQLGMRAKGIIVFPKIVKAGFGVGLQGGNGTLFLADGSRRYYQSTAVSYGLQAGIQKFSYALFLIDDTAVKQLDSSMGWELGSSPSLVIVNAGMSKSLSTTSIRKGSYAFMFKQFGLMADAGLQGAKITQINPGKD